MFRSFRIIKIESEFYKHVDLNQVSRKVGLEVEVVDFIYRYWILKRRSCGNRPLLLPRIDDAELSPTGELDNEREKLKKFVALRQDLERVRNLCYMVSRREKLQRSFVKLREQVLEKQLSLVADENCSQQLSLLEMSAVLEANHGASVYDRLFSHGDAEVHSEVDFEIILARISGEITENSAQVRKDNPYRKLASGTPTDSAKAVAYKRIFSDTSASETDDCLSMSVSKKDKKKGENNAATTTTTTAAAAALAAAAVSKKKLGKNAGGVRGSGSKKRTSSKSATTTAASASRKSRALSDMSDSELSSDNEKMKKTVKQVFSDSDSDDNDVVSPRQKSPVVRTKAAMKDFSIEDFQRVRKQAEKSSKAKTSASNSRKSSMSPTKSKKKSTPVAASSADESESETETTKPAPTKKSQSDFYPIPMIVPERAAARKATAKLKVSHQDKTASTEVSDFKVPVPEVSTKSKKSSKKSLAAAVTKTSLSDLDSSSSSDEDTKKKKKKSSSKSDFKKEEEMADAEEPLGYVPQRKAAKKASVQMKDADRTVSKKEEDLLLFGNEKPAPATKKSATSKKRGDSFLPPLSQRILSSASDSDEGPFPARSPRGLKSPRGRAAAPRSPRKSVKRPAPPPPPAKKGLSERALSFLSQRESQLDDIFEQLGFGSKKSKEQPETKLKTSEGQQSQDDQRPRTPSGSAVEVAADASAKKPAAAAADRRRSSSSSSSSSSSDSSSSSSSSSDTESAQKRDRLSSARGGDLNRSQSPQAAAAAAAATAASDRLAGEAAGRSSRVSASESRVPELHHSKEEEVRRPITPGSGVFKLEEDVKENQAPPPAVTPSRSGRDGKHFDVPPEVSPGLKSPVGALLKSPPAAFASPPANPLMSPAGGNTAASPALVNNSFASPTGQQLQQQKSVRSTPSHLPSPAAQSVTAGTPKQVASSPMKSPATSLPLRSPVVQQQQQQHQTLSGFNDSGNLVSEMDTNTSSGRKLSVESDSDKSTSSIPDLSKETCVQEALDFVEKLKMNYKESASVLASVPSPSDMSVNKQRPAKQTDEGYVSAELALNEQGNDFAKLPQESPSMPPDTRLSSSGTKDQHQLHHQSSYDMLQMQQQQLQQQHQQPQSHQQQQQQAYQDYNQLLDHRWQMQHQQHHTHDDTQNRQRELLMSYYAEVQRKMASQSHPHLSSYSGQGAGGIQDSYGMQHLKQFYPDSNTTQANWLLYQQQYAQYMQQLQYQSSSSSSNKELGQAIEQFMQANHHQWAAMNKFSHQQQQQHLQQQQPHHQSPSSSQQQQQQYSKVIEDQFKSHKTSQSSSSLTQHHQKYQQQLEQQHQHLQQQQQQHAHNVPQSRPSPSSHAVHDDYSDHLRNSMGKVQSSQQHSVQRQDSRQQAQQILQQQQQSLELQKHQLQQQREHLAHQLHHLSGDKEISVPSATPAEKLPGYVGGRAGGELPEKTSDVSAADVAGISKDLLDSIEAVAKLPVWKPDSTHESGASPSKSLNRSPDKPESTRHPSSQTEPPPSLRSIRRTSSSAASDKDKTFDDLVKKVESSPSSSKLESLQQQQQQQRGRRPLDLGSVRTPSHSESHDHSDIDKSDYDETNNKGGVDYDDFYDDDEDFVPAKGRAAALPSSSSTKITISMGKGRGRGRPRGSASSAAASAPPPQLPPPPTPAPARGYSKARGRPKAKPVTINTKALAQVHRQVAGTDYDFEDEFGDEFGEPEKNEPVSLKELREQSKKQYLPVYMQQDSKQLDKKKNVFQDFSDDDQDDFVPQPAAKRGGGRGRGARGGGRGRGRPAKSAAVSPPPFIRQELELDKPKLPKLKLGALLSRKDAKSHHRKDSFSEEVKPTVPKLKIKLGPKPPVVAASAPSPVIAALDNRKDFDVVDSSMAPKRDVSGNDDDIDPDEKDLVIAEDDDDGSFKNNESRNNEVFSRDIDVNHDDAMGDDSRSSPSDPSRRGTKIESLASKLLGTKQVFKAASELDSIFGPAVPLDVVASAAVASLSSSLQQTSAAAPQTSPYSIERSELRPSSSASVQESGLEQKSELELLQDEMALMDHKSGASPHAHNFFGPLRKAINAAKIAAESKAEDDEGSNRRQHLKMKFKVDERHTSTPDPVSASLLNAHSGGHDHRSNPYSSSSSIMSAGLSSSSASGSAMSNIRRMRKKELLNQFFGQESQYSSAPANGPSALTSAVSSMLAAMDSNPSPMNSAPPQPVRNIIKMPKAVASVTSVPTRADYQSQLEANLERKRKRDKCMSDANKAYDSSYSKSAEKGGKKKRGRGKQTDEDIEYKPKIVSESAKEEEKKDISRKTRGKPPKKCLAESPPHDELMPGDLKAENMRYAEEIRAQFEDQQDREHLKGSAGRNRQKKRRREDESPALNAKAPRLVIKFSKTSEPAQPQTDPLVIDDDPTSAAGLQPGRNGLDQYDFSDDFGPEKSSTLPMVDGTMDNFSSVNSSPAPADLANKVVPKLKIKMQIQC